MKNMQTVDIKTIYLQMFNKFFYNKFMVFMSTVCLNCYQKLVELGSKFKNDILCPRMHNIFTVQQHQQQQLTF